MPVVHHTQQISMAAVAGDAENINKQARKMRTNWEKTKSCLVLLKISRSPTGSRTSKQRTASCAQPQWRAP